MSTAAKLRVALDLEGASLLVPTLQPEALPVRSSRPAPCTQACPAGVNVKAYVSLIAEGKFALALEVVRKRCPLPGVCGRVCHHPCEAACQRGPFDEPVAIRALKRAVADLEPQLPRPIPPPGAPRPARIAVVGSGPAGLTAAFDLRMAGFPVTVFEAASEPGGMLRYGITAYRLPRDVLDAEIDVIARTGIDIRTGHCLGGDLDLEGLFSQGYHAVLLAVGAQLGRPLPAEGREHSPEVQDALEFLRRVNLGDRTPPGRKVVVVGGGSTAIEAARAALRLGAKQVEILYRRYREEVLASRDEVEVAEAEGVSFQFLVTPRRVVTAEGRLSGLECVRVGLGEPDASGRRRPIHIPGSEFFVSADRVLAAVGQEADLHFLSASRKTRLIREGRVQVDPDTAMTALPGVFAAGDVVTGPATVIEAIAAGHRAAESIRHFIEEGRPAIREDRPERKAAPEYELPDLPPIKAARVRPEFLAPTPGYEFGEVERGLTSDEAVGEARRCLRCGPCGECRICAPSCQRRHVTFRVAMEGGAAGRTSLVRVPSALALALPADRPTPGWLLSRVVAGTLREIDLTGAESVLLRPVRSRIRDNACRGCGRCVDVCPFHAVTLTDGAGGEQMARIEPGLCRGCNLCTAVCPSKAAVPTSLSPEWWGTRLEDAFETGETASPQRYVVLACQRRAGGLEVASDRAGVHVEVIRFRCLGQVDAGMLLELYRLGARAVLVAGCTSGRCRFGSGAHVAEEEVERARSVLRLLGTDPAFIVCDASDNRAGDPMGTAVRRLLGEAGLPPSLDLAAV